VVKNADIAMYHAKDMGRDNCQRYTPGTEGQPPRASGVGNNHPRASSGDQLPQQAR
jgi:hypothetical protein